MHWSISGHQKCYHPENYIVCRARYYDHSRPTLHCRGLPEGKVIIVPLPRDFFCNCLPTIGCRVDHFDDASVWDGQCGLSLVELMSFVYTLLDNPCMSNKRPSKTLSAVTYF